MGSRTGSGTSLSGFRRAFEGGNTNVAVGYLKSIEKNARKLRENIANGNITEGGK